MTLREQFKTDADKSVNGVWFDFTNAPNQDGSIPGFRLARLSVANPKYSKLLADKAEALANKNVSDADDLAEGVEVFCDSVLLEWRNFQPEDDGNVLPYNRENAIKLFTNREWSDLYFDLRRKAAAQANYAKARLEAAVKN